MVGMEREIDAGACTVTREGGTQREAIVERGRGAGGRGRGEIGTEIGGTGIGIATGTNEDGTALDQDEDPLFIWDTRCNSRAEDTVLYNLYECVYIKMYAFTTIHFLLRIVSGSLWNTVRKVSKKSARVS